MSDIQGANSFYMFYGNNKHYTLIGDQHDIKQLCSFNNVLPINILLKEWLTYNNINGIVTDFYIEEKFTHSNKRIQKRNQRDKQEASNWLETVIFEMEPCLVRDKTNCPLLPNVHSHYIDVRYVDEYGITLDPFNMDLIQRWLENNAYNEDVKHDILLLFDIYMNHYIALLNSIIRPLLKNIFVHLKKLYYGQFKVPALRNIFFNHLHNMEKIAVVRDNVLMHKAAAQLLKLSPTEGNKVRKFIYHKIEEYMMRFKQNYKEKVNTAEFLMQYDQTTKPLIFLIEGMKGDFEHLASLSMDAYTLARILSQPSSSEIIVYAGLSHIEHYKEFFTTFENITFTVNNPPTINNQCLHIDYVFNK
jgi:hypothetical protein